EVWRGRDNDEVLLTVGPTGYFAEQNPNPATPGGRLLSRVIDVAQNLSSIASADVQIDWTPPSAPSFVYDGQGASDEAITYDGTQLSATWGPSEDLHSGLLEYEYAIGTTSGDSNVVSWTPIGLTTTHTHTGLSLTNGQTYYFGVRARNQAGLVGAPRWSDGITYIDPLTTRMQEVGSPWARLYPNPASEQVIIELKEEAPTEVYLLDAHGRILRRIFCSTRQTVVEVGGLSEGLYWIWGPGFSPLPFVKQ
ncbi:MAG: T9SS type A sorting domain-containing protein, partial [Bacteroidia bacterium]|nr:T9SS type A sorting domain-containing protein [Bacteroidia bacterium]MDW8058363.1 hypothetical protein [Bacteroidia bacterium]